MKDQFVSKLYSPWIVMGISVSASLIIFLVVSVITVIPITLYAILLSTLIPAVISFPISAILIRYHKKIAQQKAELERLNELNNRLFSIIAHDIRSPIASAFSVMELLKTEDLTEEEQQEFITNLSGTFDNLLVFLNDMLEWSKQQLENQELKPKLFNTEPILDRILLLYKHMIEGKGITITRNTKAENIYANEGSYSLIVRNILHNAIKFTPKGGTISIYTDEMDDHIATTIQDTGVGMNKENLEKIINGKEWVSSMGTNNEVGTGFGLQASMKYVKLQHGHINIESEENKGTSISILLPKNP